MEITRDNFTEELISALPEIEKEVRDWNGLLHLEVMELRVHTEEAIEAGDFDLVRRCFAFADRAIQSSDQAVWNAVHVSYLEDLDLAGPHGEKAKELLTPALTKGRKDIDDYMNALLEKEWRDAREERGFE